MSDFHPESWSPAWNVATIVRGVVSFMAEETQTYGSIQTDTATREKFAQHSRHANLKMSAFLASFPSRATATRALLERQQQEQQAAAAAEAASRAAAPASPLSPSPPSVAAAAQARGAALIAKLSTSGRLPPSSTDSAAAAAVAAAGDDVNAAIAPGWVPQRNFLVQGRQWVADGFGLMVGGGVRMAFEAWLSPNGAPGGAPPVPVAPADAAAPAAAAGAAGAAAVVGTERWREEPEMRRRTRQLLWVIMSLVIAVIALAINN
jgi:hypothetical protein